MTLLVLPGCLIGPGSRSPGDPFELDGRLPAGPVWRRFLAYPEGDDPRGDHGYDEDEDGGAGEEANYLLQELADHEITQD
ncbi:hypothetical protein [Streptomyces sp. NPDC006012]|uniref:hypothetical protein n=1 Tax=Streptomyces sp. NPDC006012 TaxID=3364739 RepID=UPI0036B1F84F